MLTTTAMLVLGGGAALLGALFEGSSAALQGSGMFVLLGAGGAIGLLRRTRLA